MGKENDAHKDASEERKPLPAIKIPAPDGNPLPPHHENHLPRWLPPVAFFIGVVLMTVILVLVVYIPNPTVAQFVIFRTIIALSGAAFAMAITGFLVVKIPLPGTGYIVGGGALAVFVVLYFFSPASAIGIKPPSPPSPKISFRKDRGVFIASESNTLAQLLRLGLAAKPEAFELERPREIDDVLRSASGDALASESTREFLRNWLKDENNVKVQTLRILIAFANRPLVGSNEAKAFIEEMEKDVAKRGVAVASGDKALEALSASINAPMAPGQEVDDAILRMAGRYVSTAISELYGSLRYLDPRYIVGLDDSFKAYLASMPERHDDIVKRIGYSEMVSQHFVELECGNSLSYSRFLVPENEIRSRHALERLRHGPWPIGAPADYFSEYWWLQNAVWQMLAREHGTFQERLPLKIGGFTVCGPP